MSLSRFHPIVQQWFAAELGEPTAAQQRGWEAIGDGRHTLIAAPTGSGKTLAAFLTALDDLFKEGLAAPLPDEVRVLYVSPLKALSADIHKNLAEPRRGIRRLAEEAGLPAPRITAAVRTGDTTAVRARGDAADAAAHPGHDAGVALPAAHGGAQPADAAHRPHGHRRRDPRGHRHAARRAPGAVARAAAGRWPTRPLLRLGLSATQKPIEEVARFLVGLPDDDDRGCAIVDEGHRRRDGSRRRDAAVAARSGDVARGLGGVLRPAGGAHPRRTGRRSSS